MKSKLLFFRFASLLSLVLLLLLVLHWIETHSKAGNDLTNVAVGGFVYNPGTALTKTTAYLWPDPAITDFALHGSAPYSDPEGDFAGTGTFRWLRNGILLESGFVPQSLLLPMDGSLLSTDGQSPTQSSGLNLVPGRFGQAVHTSLLADSKLAYPTSENVNPKEGSIEMWVQLSNDLGRLGNANYHPRLFSYTIDSERQLYIEINSGRIVLASRNLGQFLSTWPNPPNWRANEWHLITATWSAIANRQAIYYDCVLQDEVDFPALNGSTDEFYLGSDENVATIDADLDDVRLSRRALSAEEAAAACSRPGPTPNNEVILPANQLRTGDQITYEFTPCDINGSCDLTASTNTLVAPPPLGPLQPSPGILSEDTITFTLVLTTQVLADCRWSEKANTPYSDMLNIFGQGQGTTEHSTTISTSHDYFDYHIYVRCADLATGRDPDSYHRSTYLRMQKPGVTDYPRLASMSGVTDPRLGDDYLTSFEVLMLDSQNSKPRLADYIRNENPSEKILLTINAAFSQSQTDPLTAEWMDRLPGDPGYNCLMRDSLGGILKHAGFDTPIYNLTVSYCRDQLLQFSLAAFNPNILGQGEVLDYDGIYLEDLNSSISWTSALIDSDLDGKTDDPTALDVAYKAGVLDFLTKLREALPQAVFVSNTSDPSLSTWLDGSVFGWQNNTSLDRSEYASQWNTASVNLLDWTNGGNHPRLNFIRNYPDLIDYQKYTHIDQIPPALITEAAASYQRMRFGLITALMGNSVYSYDLGLSETGPTWWYDEYGINPGFTAGNLRLPPPGYLGQPVGEPSLLVNRLDSPNLIENGDFQNGLQDWNLNINQGSGATGELTVDASTWVESLPAAHILVGGSFNQASVGLWQSGLNLTKGQDYSLSFWARSDKPRTLTIFIDDGAYEGNGGFNGPEVRLNTEWQQYHLNGVADNTTNSGELVFLMGETAGEVWLDDIQFQAGSIGVWSRPFANGLALINATYKEQTVSLPSTYCKLDGNQAPLFETRIDDKAAIASPGWVAQQANLNQLGDTVTEAQGGSFATLDYVPDLAYPGIYEVLVWIAPAEDQSSSVDLTIHHADGVTKITIDETVGQVGWYSLGYYNFYAGNESKVQFTATGTGMVVGDAVKWVSAARYNDGKQVDQITLQPQDGIILLSSCYQPGLLDFLPLVIR